MLEVSCDEYEVGIIIVNGTDRTDSTDKSISKVSLPILS
jgi:hypothetical protein